MFKYYAAVFLFFYVLSASAQNYITYYEKSGFTESPDYFTIIKWWQKLDEASGKVKMLVMDSTDAGEPLHLVVVSENGDWNFNNIRAKNKRLILINNGIHPGEPDGIDASMLMVRDIVSGKLKLPQNVVLAIIPVYNIGGCLNRSENYRVDQNGPKAFGSRGNSQNLDLNRDFVKCDSKDARAFARIFHKVQPDVFVDNHVSNGADYQHVMTLLTTAHNKLDGQLGNFIDNEFEPALYKSMEQKGFPMIPYVNVWGSTPDNGWTAYWDGPRYASGYAAMWQCLAFVPETHMLKPYRQRVEATYELMKSFIDFTAANSDKIAELRKNAINTVKVQKKFTVEWTVDSSQKSQYDFKGYEAEYLPSEVSGIKTLKYNRQKPYQKNVTILKHYQPVTTVTLPDYYVLPQGWWKVVELLQLNNVIMHRLKKDTAINVSYYRINNYKSTPQQYEMHHPNSQVSATEHRQTVEFRKGDWLIPANQVANRFLAEVLEPVAPDSYFAWNYFDAILTQKEGYSAYAFEDHAAQYLKLNPQLKQKLEAKKAADSEFAANAAAQLRFVYENSPWMEPGYKKYPVYKINR